VTHLLDVNALMALLWPNHEHWAKSRAWLRTVQAFATCPVVQLGFARISCHPLLEHAASPESAFAVLRRFIADPRHTFVPDDLSCTDRVLHTELILTPNQVTDRYLVALAQQHGLVLATLDQPLAERFSGTPNLVHLIE